jgi:hypothetical protein
MLYPARFCEPQPECLHRRSGSILLVEVNSLDLFHRQMFRDESVFLFYIYDNRTKITVSANSRLRTNRLSSVVVQPLILFNTDLSFARKYSAVSYGAIAILFQS